MFQGSLVVLQIYEENLRNVFGTKVIIEKKKNGLGKIIIDLQSEHDLDRILELIEKIN